MKPNPFDAAPEPDDNHSLADEAAVSVIEAFSTPHYRERIIRPGVILFTPPVLFMPRPVDEPIWFNDVTRDGRPQWMRMSDIITNVAHVFAGVIPEEKPSAIADWWIEPTNHENHSILRGTLLRHPVEHRQMVPNWSTSILVAIAPEEGWALTMSGWYALFGRDQ